MVLIRSMQLFRQRDGLPADPSAIVAEAPMRSLLLILYLIPSPASANSWSGIPEVADDVSATAFEQPLRSLQYVPSKGSGV